MILKVLLPMLMLIATVSQHAYANNPRAKIDDIIVISSPTADTNGDGRVDGYGLGDTIRIAVTFDQVITWDVSAIDKKGRQAAIKMDLRIGGQVRRISAVVPENHGTTNTLQFQYTVQKGDNDVDGITLQPFGQDLLLLTRGATLRSVSNNRHALRQCTWCNGALNLGQMVLAEEPTLETEVEEVKVVKGEQTLAQATGSQSVQAGSNDNGSIGKTASGYNSWGPWNVPPTLPRAFSTNADGMVVADSAGEEFTPPSSRPSNFPSGAGIVVNFNKLSGVTPWGVPYLPNVPQFNDLNARQWKSGDTGEGQYFGLWPDSDTDAEGFVQPEIAGTRWGVENIWYNLPHDATASSTQITIHAKRAQRGLKTYGQKARHREFIEEAWAYDIKRRHGMWYTEAPYANWIWVFDDSEDYPSHRDLCGLARATKACPRRRIPSQKRHADDTPEQRAAKQNYLWTKGGWARDYFTTGAWYQVDTPTLPTGVQGTSATWNGHMIAFESNPANLGGRGGEVGGDARITVNFGADTTSHTVDVALTKIASALAQGGNFADQNWNGLTLQSNGGFVHSDSARSIEGGFGVDDKVAGKFEINGRYLKYPHEFRWEIAEIQSVRGSTCMLSSDLMVVARPSSGSERTACTR